MFFQKDILFCLEGWKEKKTFFCVGVFSVIFNILVGFFTCCGSMCWTQQLFTIFFWHLGLQQFRFYNIHDKEKKEKKSSGLFFQLFISQYSITLTALSVFWYFCIIQEFLLLKQTSRAYITNLECGYRTNPQGISFHEPKLSKSTAENTSWKLIRWTEKLSDFVFHCLSHFSDH